MHHIEYLVDKIDDELDGAMEYAERALMCRDKDASFADALHQMAEQELHHATTLKSHLKSMLSKHEAEHGAMSDVASDLIEWAHKKFSEKEIAIKKTLEMRK